MLTPTRPNSLVIRDSGGLDDLGSCKIGRLGSGRRAGGGSGGSAGVLRRRAGSVSFFFLCGVASFFCSGVASRLRSGVGCRVPGMPSGVLRDALSEARSHGVPGGLDCQSSEKLAGRNSIESTGRIPGGSAGRLPAGRFHGVRPCCSTGSPTGFSTGSSISSLTTPFSVSTVTPSACFRISKLFPRSSLAPNSNGVIWALFLMVVSAPFLTRSSTISM